MIKTTATANEVKDAKLTF